MRPTPMPVSVPGRTSRTEQHDVPGPGGVVMVHIPTKRDEPEVLKGLESSV